ncbi:hypothetical protein [Shinella zoogloeoides]|uniref:hypothetical protein n=1 Tax=Shinella zoogloeoides TaxID=352475 RepID=UPI00273FA110|nr:hypothetical protein [Shinella zoogloeoides]WLR90997.1 hypothetical protein Q9316_00180 [Shinella zoogloeoides]
MIQNRLNQEADQAAARYGLLVDGWQGLFGRALNAIDFGTASHAAHFISEALEMAQTYMRQEAVAFDDVFEEIASEAHQTTLDQIASNDANELTERVTDHLRTAQQYAADELLAQINRDLALMRRALQRVALEVYAASRSRGISQRQALIEYRIGNVAELDFAFHDRTNRKWSSRKFVRTLWRHSLLSVYNEVVMLTLADHGLRRARVVHLDPNAESHDTLIAFSSSADLPTYSEIRDTIFHPNANAILAMEGSSVSA